VLKFSASRAPYHQDSCHFVTVVANNCRAKTGIITIFCVTGCKFILCNLFSFVGGGLLLYFVLGELAPVLELFSDSAIFLLCPTDVILLDNVFKQSTQKIYFIVEI
jgi:hypothetical protein